VAAGVALNRSLPSYKGCLCRSNMLLSKVETHTLTPSVEISRHSTAQEMLQPLWNPKVHYRVHKSPPLVPILTQYFLTLSLLRISQVTSLQSRD
jgi:hypothetical protein